MLNDEAECSIEVSKSGSTRLKVRRGHCGAVTHGAKPSTPSTITVTLPPDTLDAMDVDMKIKDDADDKRERERERDADRDRERDKEREREKERDRDRRDRDRDRDRERDPRPAGQYKLIFSSICCLTSTVV